MFRRMRKVNKLLTKQDAEAILDRNTNGVLAVHGDDGYPYAVPLSYVYAEGRIFFHGAVEGHKMDAILRNDKVSFCVVDHDDIAPEEFNTYFASVIVFGRARILERDEEKQAGLEFIVRKYSPDYFEKGLDYIKATWDRVNMFEIVIEHMTGKSAVRQ
ncbi:nitroimidazole resistance protein [Clostridia bacterium]|nr:nitroimidazole resistance protein [Clostridia bacterium]